MVLQGEIEIVTEVKCVIRMAASSIVILPRSKLCIIVNGSEAITSHDEYVTAKLFVHMTAQ